MNRLTIKTYNQNAEAYAHKFAGVGSRIRDVERVFQIWGKPNPIVLELGCGDGRDAVEICTRTKKYLGIDASQGMIELAKLKAPSCEFRVASMEDFEFARETNIIFAFAALLHVDKAVFKQILAKSISALSRDGIFYLSLKEGDYKEGGEIVIDKFGERVFYYYREADVREMSEGFECISVEKSLIGHTNWLNIMLRKI